MLKIKNLLIESAKELQKTKSLTVAALLIAISVILAQFRLEFGNLLRIGFSDRTIEFAGYLFGPITGAIFGACSDIINYLYKPQGDYFFGFTFNNILKGLIYGFALYKTPLKLKNIIIAEVLVAVICNMLLGTYWLTILYGKVFSVIFPLRALKNLLLIPIDVFIFYTLAQALERFGFRGRLSV